MILKDDAPKPFLRWAGGKNWLIKHLPAIIGNSLYNNYHEPFLGGGAVFFSLNHGGKAFLSDFNEELITTYKSLKKDHQLVAKYLSSFKNTKSFYYEVRERNFSLGHKIAARFIYLNQTSYNGIYRVNLNGKYNVPYGFRTKNFFDPENLAAVSKALKGTSIQYGDFEIVLENLKRKDLVFLDPPYTVSHNHNGFIKYNQKLFSLEDQHRLASLIEKIKTKGAYYILTNAAHSRIREIFDSNDRLVKLSRASLIGGLNANRGSTEEYIFTNFRR